MFRNAAREEMPASVPSVTLWFASLTILPRRRSAQRRRHSWHLDPLAGIGDAPVLYVEQPQLPVRMALHDQVAAVTRKRHALGDAADGEALGFGERPVPALQDHQGAGGRVVRVGRGEV